MLPKALHTEITRKAFVTALAAPFVALASVRKPRREFYVNFRAHGYPGLEPSLLGGRVFIEGREILGVWYLDTIAGMGLVKSYDIYQNGGKPKLAWKQPAWPEFAWIDGSLQQLPFPEVPEVGTHINGVLVHAEGPLLSITLRGRIELFGANGKRLYPA